MKLHTYCRWGTLCLCLFVLASCGPSLTQEELEQMETGNTPQPQDSNFHQALRALGRTINTGGESQKTFLVAPIGNSSGKKELPLEITSMVISSVNQVAGPYLLHAQYPSGGNAPAEQVVRIVVEQPNAAQPAQAAPNETEGHAAEQALVAMPEQATLIINGTISEFDQDISVKEHGWNLNFFISPEIEDEIVDVDLNAEFNKAETMSRIAIDFHLVDATIGRYVPYVNCTNSILVYDIQKNRQWRFIIYGSGFTRWGKIQVKQGVHEALRKLVDYSMLQLFGAYYGLPYWRTLGLESPEKGREMLVEWRRRFLDPDLPSVAGQISEEELFLLKQSVQISEIQRLLLKYPLREAYIQGILRNQDALYEEGGAFGRITQAFILKFLYRYVPSSPLLDTMEQGGLIDDQYLADLYLTLVQHVPML